MNIFKVAGVRRPLDTKTKIDMILDFFWKNGFILDRFIDYKIRESITDGRLLTYYERHTVYKDLLYASNNGLGVKIHLSTGHKKATGFPRHKKNYRPKEKQKGMGIDIFKKEGEIHKPSIGELLEQSRASLGKKKPRQWLKIISVPMGGQNKKY